LALFCFHQVLPGKDRLRASEPDVGEFKRDVEIIDNTFNVLTVEDGVRRLFEGSLPVAAACITFDDGYADNHATAAPILESAGIPATFFVAGGAVDEGIMWNDLIIEALAECGSEAAFYALPVDVSDKERQVRDGSFVGDLLGKMKYLPTTERWESSRKFYTDSTGNEPPRLMMTRAEVSNLSKRGFEIGGHTLNHPILETIDVSEATREISGCYRWVAEVTGRKPTSFAYPNGVPGRDFSTLHEDIVRSEGFECALSTHWSLANRDTNRFCIPRVGPWWRQGYGYMRGLSRVYLTSYLR
jgi:peptidoglycan/xylan/chitin deacetylase (PgdA/CDA1 family)